MVEEQIESKILTRDLKRILTPDESKADAEFEQELTNVVEQSSLYPSTRMKG
jgi:hypothetical protein